MPAPHRRPPTRSTAAAAAACLLALLAGCSSGTASAGPSAADQGYISGDGTVRTVAEADRGGRVRLAGTTLDGETFDLRDHRGEVVVVNVWGSWCPPCIAEAPALQAVAEQTAPDGVQFVGIAFQDNRAAALAHERRFGISYPSLFDADGRLLLSLRGSLPPRAVPSTLVLDRAGRVAARVLGEVGEVTLRTLVRDTLDEPQPGLAP